MTMRVKVIKYNVFDENPWLVSDLPFWVVKEWTDHQGQLIYLICPWGSTEEQQRDKSHAIPADHTAPHEWKTL